jgi:hypothetical protein
VTHSRVGILGGKAVIKTFYGLPYVHVIEAKKSEEQQTSKPKDSGTKASLVKEVEQKHQLEVKHHIPNPSMKKRRDRAMRS